LPDAEFPTGPARLPYFGRTQQRARGRAAQAGFVVLLLDFVIVLGTSAMTRAERNRGKVHRSGNA
jgi:hypothetical protein